MLAERCSAKPPYVLGLALFALSLLILVVLQRSGNLQLESLALGWQRVDTGLSSAPPLLRRVFVCVTFHFDVSNLINLKTTLLVLTAYPTVVHVCVATDNAQKLKPALARWAFSGVGLCDVRNTSAADAFRTKHKSAPGKHWGVTWYHHSVMQDAATRDYTAYMLLEDDLCPSWSGLVSWARDAPLLERRGFQRCFYRTEYRPRDGHIVMLDQQQKLNLTDWDKFVDIDEPLNARCNYTSYVRRSGGVNESEAAPASFAELCGASHHSERCIHQHYIQLPRTYQGFWVASKPLLQAYIKSRWWDPQYALNATGPVDIRRWRVPERANGVIQFVNVPEGWNSACLIPWVPEMRALSPSAMVEHDRLKYAIRKRTKFARIPYAEYLVGNRPGTDP